MKLLNKINYIFDTKQKVKLVFLLILILMGSVLELLGVSAVLPLIDIALKPEVIYENEIYVFVAELFSLEDVNSFIFFISGVLVILYIFKNIYLVLCKNYQFKFTYNLNKTLSLKLMNCYLHQDYLFHVSHNVAELQRNITTDVSQFVDTVSTILNLVVEGCICVLLIAFLVITDPITSTLIIAVLAIALLGYWKISKKLQLLYGIEARSASAELNKWLLQSFGGIKEIKVMNREQFFLNNYDASYCKNIVANKKYNIVTMLPKYVTETIIICSILVTLNIRILQGANIGEFVSVLTAIAVAAMKMLPAFNRITEHMSKIMFNKSGVDNVFKDLKEIEKLERKSELQKKDIERLQLRNEIRVENLTFAYPNTDKKIFEDASLVIKEKSSVAFVGSSGAGKTTLADIIIGVLEPDAGHVYVDGTDVFTHLDAWHKTIGYIPQMIYLMDDTIRANIVFGITEKEIDDEKVWKALERAELSEFVKELKDGIYTKIGDRGVRLSGGQRQRIGIARALYSEPDVLILDEATSALDNETEAAVMESIDNLHGKATLIIIAHRLTTIQNCDEVYEVDHGRITLKKGNNNS